MNKLQLPHAKLFYMISELSKKQLINDTEKRVLKEKTISDDIEIFQLLDKYQKTKNQDDLSNQLIDLTRNKPSFGLALVEVESKEVPESIDGASNQVEGENNGEQSQEAGNQNGEEIKAEDIGVDINDHTEVSSPVGTSLHLQKYKHSLNMNNVIKNELLQPKKAGDEVDTNL